RLVTLQHRDDESDEEHTWYFELALGSRVKRLLGFGEPIDEEIGPGKIAIGKRKIGIRRDGFLRGVNGSLVSSGPMGGNAAEQTVRIVLLPVRIRLLAQLEGLVRLFQV